MADPVQELVGAVNQAAVELSGDSLAELPRLERPPRPDFGDYSTNAAMLLAPQLGEPPRAIAERLGDTLRAQLGSAVAKLEIAGPGFLNLFMGDDWYLAALAGLVEAGERYGAGSPGTRERISVEFVSGNPTGPLTVAHGRHAAYGDALCRLLEFAGQAVEREYYVNDYGSQVLRFGESIRARARGEEPPQDGYMGGYVGEMAERIDAAAETEPAELASRGIELMLEGVRATLDRFRVRMDGFFSERSLHSEGAVDGAIELLAERDYVYSHEGAVWLRTTALGDDKDRVLKRSSGELTYFASDIAYHANKLERGYDRVLDVLGADHHGYVGRIRAGWQALGGDPERLELLIMQLVNLTEGGRRVRMSRREGEFVTVDDLLDDIGVDAARWFLLQRSHDTTLDLDLELARQESQENPVYYVQYAHARIASILRKAGEERVRAALAAELAASDEVLHPSARSLLKRLLEFPGEIAEAATRRAPHRLTAYVHETAQEFSAFYRDCRVLGAAEEGGDEDVRLAMCVMAARVIERCLELLGVEAPEEM
jgi:arginyl-tRNA synthetase